MKNRSEKMAERGQFLTISPGNSRSIAQENGKKWTVPTFLQPISFKSDRLLGTVEAERFVAALTRERFDYTVWRKTGLSEIDIESLSAVASHYAKQLDN